MSLICEIAYQALKIEATILLRERISRGWDVAELVWQVDGADLPECHLCSAISVVQQWNPSRRECSCWQFILLIAYLS